MCASPQASRKPRTSSYSACQFPVSTCPRVMTMSISRAPSATLAFTSSMRVESGDSPAGNPVLTAATGMFDPASASTATGTSWWYTQTAPVVMCSSSTPSARSRSGRIGCIAFAQRRRTFSSRVVAGERRKIDERNRAEQPARLATGFLDGAAPRQRSRAPFDCAPVPAPLREHEIGESSGIPGLRAICSPGTSWRLSAGPGSAPASFSAAWRGAFIGIPMLVVRPLR